MTYPTPANTTRFEIAVRKSRFIATTGLASNHNDTKRLLLTTAEEFPDANHICHACIIGSPDNGSASCNDDGEPTGTAGKPILNVLQHSGVGDIITIVVRYFGGIKLGTGGLVRAYSNSTSGSLSDLQTIIAETLVELEFIADFSLENEIRHQLATVDAREMKISYGHRLMVSCKIPSRLAEPAVDRLKNLARGQIAFSKNPTGAEYLT